ncbi:MAG: family 10 glycosylhydrolase [Candidatus Wallbacteria bacterium]|nr:family 10 glycosylhydrolase [Candidatus Wallbacteria bacterium]
MKLLCMSLFLLLCCSSFAASNTEFRSIWICTWDTLSADNTVDQNKARIRGILDNIKKANMNAALWQVRQDGTVYFPSSYEPWGSYIGSADPGFDPLEYAVQEAHKRGLELYAWVNTFESRKKVKGSPANEHPEWICRDSGNKAMPAQYSLSPGLPEVREYLIKVLMEIVNKYDVDGIQMDYVRWSEYTTSSIEKYPYTLEGPVPDEVIAALADNGGAGSYLYDAKHPKSQGIPSGYSTWDDWRRASVNEFVKGMHAAIQASSKPHVKLAASVLGKYNWSGWNGYYSVYQDSALWYNKGYVDILMGMHYHWTDAAGFQSMLATGSPECWRDFIQEGVAAGRLFTVGPASYILDEQGLWSRHPAIVEACRKFDIVSGFQFFSYDSWVKHNYWSEAAAGFFKSTAKVPSILPAREHLNPPSVDVFMAHSMQKKIIRVVPPDTLDPAKNYRFAVYRSTDDYCDPAIDEIVSVHFGGIEPFLATDSYLGDAQYYATTIDRNWNESGISNLAR